MRVPSHGGTAIEELRRTESALFTVVGATREIRSASADITVATRGTSDLVDVTDRVRAVIAETDIETGLALVSTPHTTCAVIVNESESGFSADLAGALESLAPRSGRYEHDDAPHDEEFESPNGYAHVRAAFVSSPSVTLPIRDGDLTLGRWQRIFLVELDRARPRTVQITLLGRS